MSPANVHCFPGLRSELLGLLRRHVSRPRAHGQRLDWARGHVGGDGGARDCPAINLHSFSVSIV